MPAWLSRHGGAIRKGIDGRTWFVMLDNEPQYVLTPIPAAGKFACEVMQTVNGRRLQSGNVYPSVNDAMEGGLEELRKSLGW
jgi:hypothetical protein